MAGYSTGKEYLSSKGGSGRVFSPEQPEIELTRLVHAYILRWVLYEPGAGGSSGRRSSGRCLAAPFGDYKESGIGRENGLETLHKYTQLKTAWIELSGETRDPFKLG